MSLTHTRSVWMGTALVGALIVWYCLRDPLRKVLIGTAVVGATTLKPLYRPPPCEARRYNVTL